MKDENMIDICVSDLWPVTSRRERPTMTCDTGVFVVRVHVSSDLKKKGGYGNPLRDSWRSPRV